MQDVSKWSAILDDSFVFTLPITPYMPFNKAEVVNRCHTTPPPHTLSLFFYVPSNLSPLLLSFVAISQRVLSGIHAVVADVSSLAMMIETVGFGTPAWVEATIK
jgi:hypothetical protein